MLYDTKLKETLLFNKEVPNINIPIYLIHPTKVIISQGFGYDFQYNGTSFYGGWGLKGHNGIDYAVEEGTEVIAPCKLNVNQYHEDNEYGNTLWAHSDEWLDTATKLVCRLEMCFAHLKSVIVSKGIVPIRTPIAISGNSGYGVTSTGAHLHFGVRLQFKDEFGNWKILNYDNGFLGYFNHYYITQDMFKLIKASGSNDIYAVDEISKKRHRICNEFTLNIGKETGLFSSLITEVPTIKNYTAGVEMMFTPLDKE